MDGERALDTLGVTRDASEEDIRRAYLRRVKAHPPERDPEGFQRAREAYELLKGTPWLFTSRAMKVPGPPLASDDAPQPVAAGSLASTALERNASSWAGRSQPFAPHCRDSNETSSTRSATC